MVSLYLSKDAKEINASIRRTTSTGRQLGSEGFIKELEKVLKRDLFPQKVGRSKKRQVIYGKYPLYSYVSIQFGQNQFR